MVGVFDELERRYGGATEFLRSTGLSDEDLGLAAARLGITKAFACDADPKDSRALPGCPPNPGSTSRRDGVSQNQF